MNSADQTFWGFISGHQAGLLTQVLKHLELTLVSLFIAIAVGLPLGVFIAAHRRMASFVLGITGVLQTIPGIALLGFLLPFTGIGATPAIVALFIYALLPIVRNTYTGITGVDKAIVESAKGMGMSGLQVLYKVELPLAMPVIFAGVRTATVINVGVATLAAYIGAGGLGEYIFAGIALNNSVMILAGAVPAALLALVLDFLLSRLERLHITKLRSSYRWLSIAGVFMVVAYFVPGTSQQKLVAGFTPEFMGRPDGNPGLENSYNLHLPIKVLSDAIMYKALYDAKVDVISGYSTDGRLKAYDLKLLTDDAGIFPPYYVAPVVREDVLARYPDLERVLNLLAGKINDSIMTELNYRADFLHQQPEKIAADFLKTAGLWRMPVNGVGGAFRIGSKIFSEQYILSEMYACLVRGYTDLQVEQKTGLGGTKICFEALKNNQIDMYPEYTGTGLLVILQPQGEKLNTFEKNKDSVYIYVKNGFHEQYHLKWLQPVGFNNAYALMMRHTQCQQLKINTITDLKNYIDTK